MVLRINVINKFSLFLTTCCMIFCEILEYTLHTAKTYGEMWSIVSSEDRTKHMFVVKMLFCGPFLFNQPNSLSDQVIHPCALDYMMVVW